MYTPNPIKTDQIDLPEDLEKLTELLAEHTHDVWATQRLATGWTYGEKRDDTNKKHPCLVAYKDLPESEKTYDRNTSNGTLKAILALGYKIEKA